MVGEGKKEEQEQRQRDKRENKKEKQRKNVFGINQNRRRFHNNAELFPNGVEKLCNESLLIPAKFCGEIFPQNFAEKFR